MNRFGIFDSIKEYDILTALDYIVYNESVRSILTISENKREYGCGVFKILKYILTGIRRISLSKFFQLFRNKVFLREIQIIL